MVEPKQSEVPTLEFPLAANPAAKRARIEQEKSRFEVELERLYELSATKHVTDWKQHWKRPLLPKFDPRSDDLSFQQIEVEDFIETENGVERNTLLVYGLTNSGMV